MVKYAVKAKVINAYAEMLTQKQVIYLKRSIVKNC